MRVREATRDDEVAVLELYRATPELHKNAVVDFLNPGEFELATDEKTEKTFLVAEDDDGTILGFAYVKIKALTIDEEKARLLHLVVRQGMRRRGIAQALMVECKQILRARGISKFYTCFNVANIAMQAFLLREGFRPTFVYHRFETDLSDLKPFNYEEEYGPADE